MTPPVPPIPDPNNPADPNLQVIDSSIPPVVQQPPTDPLAPLMGYLQGLEQRFNGALGAIQNQQAEFNNQLQNFRNQPAPQLPVQLPDPTQDLSGYLDQRLGQMQNALQQDLRNTVAPLNQSVSQFTNANAYLECKRRVLSSAPNLQPYWYMIEPQLDQAFGSGRVPITDQGVQLAAFSLFGQLAANNQLVPQQVNQFQQPQNRQQIPPMQIPTQRQVPPINPGQQNFPPLNELEKRMARENGMTDLEYRQLQGNAQGSAGPMRLPAAGTR